MKNVCLYVMLFFIGFKSFGQEIEEFSTLALGPVDIIFLVDNTNSIKNKVTGTAQDREYEDMYISVQNLMQNVLNCNYRSKVAVVQFAANDTNEYGRIYIEGDGTFKATAFPFERRFDGGGGWVYDSVNTLKNVLMGLPNSTSPQVVFGAQTLTRTPGSKLVVCLITDSDPNGVLDLVPLNAVGNARYTHYTMFKDALDANFVFILGPESTGLSSLDKSIAAGIATGNGDYTGTVENYSQDPSGPGVTGRRLLIVGNDPDVPEDANFLLNSTQLGIISDYLCMPTYSSYCQEGQLILTNANVITAPNEVYYRIEGTITASNTINSGATAVYRSGTAVALQPGFHGKAGSKFRGYVGQCSNPQTFSAAEETMRKISEEEVVFTLSPNPATDKVTISSDTEMAGIIVTSLDGTTYFSGVPKTTSYELNISNYAKGIYVVNVTTTNGENEVKKLIKN